MKKLNFILRLVSEWPFGPPHYPLRRLFAHFAGKMFGWSLRQNICWQKEMLGLCLNANCALKKTVEGS